MGVGRTKWWLALGLGLAGLAAQPAEAAWWKAETTHFRVYGDGREASLRGIASRLEEYDRLLRLLTGVSDRSSPTKVDVYIVEGWHDLNLVAPGVSPLVQGVYFAGDEAIQAFSAGGIGATRGDTSVLFHEYAHHFMRQYFPNLYPAWYVEGFAEYLMTADFTDKEIEVGKFDMGRGYALLRERWIPIRRILSAQYLGADRDDVNMAYAESWLLVHYLVHPERLPALTHFLEARTSGVGEEKAFEAAFGTDIEAFEKKLRTYMDGDLPFVRYPRLADAERAAVTVEALPASADSVLLLRAALRRKLPQDAGLALLAKARSAATRFAGDGLAQLVLAQAEIGFGDPKAAIALLDPMIAASPGVDNLYLRGRAELVLGDRPGADRAAHYAVARSWFARANRLDPDHYQSLHGYVQSLSLQPMSPNTLNVLLKSYLLAPQVRDIAVEAGLALMHDGQFARARKLLEPFANDPHGGAEAEQIRALLNKATAGHGAGEGSAGAADMPH